MYALCLHCSHSLVFFAFDPAGVQHNSVCLGGSPPPSGHTVAFVSTDSRACLGGAEAVASRSRVGAERRPVRWSSSLRAPDACEGPTRRGWSASLRVRGRLPNLVAPVRAIVGAGKPKRLGEMAPLRCRASETWPVTPSPTRRCRRGGGERSAWSAGTPSGRRRCLRTAVRQRGARRFPPFLSSA
jgi:hypothetical protein